MSKPPKQEMTNKEQLILFVVTFLVIEVILDEFILKAIWPKNFILDVLLSIGLYCVVMIVYSRVTNKRWP